ncbi:MAG: phage tail protein [Planctomycetes bacterium]|nr:phage tail protein [Planctomycetota bacterium]
MNPLFEQDLEARAEDGGLVRGVAVALVTDNQDPQELGRVRVAFPWRPQEESHWARIAVTMAGDRRGTWFLPEVGDEVLVAFDRGDLAHPYVIGALWNGQDAPPASNEGQNRLRTIKTKIGHEITFDDGGDRSVLVKTVDGRQVLLDQQGIVLDDGAGNSVKLDANGGAIEVQAALSIKLSAPTIEIDASASLTLQTSGNATLKGSMVMIN